MDDVIDLLGRELIFKNKREVGFKAVILGHDVSRRFGVKSSPLGYSRWEPKR